MKPIVGVVLAIIIMFVMVSLVKVNHDLNEKVDALAKASGYSYVENKNIPAHFDSISSITWVGQ